LPNDEAIQLQKGTRSLQIKNSLRAKLSVLAPMVNMLIAEDQLSHLTFEALFANVVFHEIAHSLGIKHTLTGRGSVREALSDQQATLEEAKADILGLLLVSRLAEWGEWEQTDLRDNYVAALASMLASIRLGAASAHGRANLLALNFLKERGALSRDGGTGRYRVHFEQVLPAISALAERILRLQGDGDREGVLAFSGIYGHIGHELQADLDRLASARIPVDIVFEPDPNL